MESLSESEESESGKECSSSEEYETDSSKKERSGEKDEEEVGIEWLSSSSYETSSLYEMEATENDSPSGRRRAARGARE